MKTYEEMQSRTEKGNSVVFFVKDSALFVKVGNNEYLVEYVSTEKDRTKKHIASVTCEKDGKTIHTTLIENVEIVAAMYYASKKNALLVSSTDNYEIMLDSSNKYGQEFTLFNDDWSEMKEHFAYKYN